MVYNISYRPKDALQQIDEKVGSTFSLLERVRMNGAGSPKLRIYASSPDVTKLLDINSDIKYLNVELRKGGIILHMQSKLDVYALPIPYHHLSVYQNGKAWSFHGAGSFVKAHPLHGDKSFSRFVRKLLKLKGAHCGESV